jgi:steroid 5-alpha reductase family enzyme
VTGTRFVVVSAATLGVAVLAMALTVVAARRAGRASVVDTTWGVALTAVAVVAAALGDGDLTRRWLVVALVAAWGLRLSWHMHRRNAGAGEDPRYAAMLREGGALRRVWLPQGAAVWLVSLPVQANAVAYDQMTVVGWTGVAVWGVGVFFEAVGDAQLAAYKRDPDRGPVLDRGLWRWTRHPNYFGDAAVWWGIWLVAAWPWPGLLTAVSPVAMTYFLVFATGARLLEQTMMQRPGYPEYAARTSMFVPRPPRRS